MESGDHTSPAGGASRASVKAFTHLWTGSPQDREFSEHTTERPCKAEGDFVPSAETAIGCQNWRSHNISEETVHLIWTILIGFVAGLVAKMLTPGSGPGGFFLTAALGIAGSLAATYLGQLLGLYSAGQSAGFIGAVVGAVVLLLVYHLATKK
jgi:uncharacterized membrane protein YeaQ/YmgE (transglycosylase-associated protein family)